MDNQKARESFVNLTNNIQRKDIEDRFMRDEKNRLREKQQQDISKQNIKSLGNNLANASRGVNDLFSDPKKGKRKTSYSNMGVIGNVPRF